ncbi:MAG: hypothetical protein R2864_10585 [Syntrophotaleaceae bacterium]
MTASARPMYPCDPSKVVAIVESREPDNGRSLGATDHISERIAGHILDFLGAEVKAGRLPANLLPCNRASATLQCRWSAAW